MATDEEMIGMIPGIGKLDISSLIQIQIFP
jgi:hypothetical protein